jgi:hypothetical protein
VFSLVCNARSLTPARALICPFAPNAGANGAPESAPFADGVRDDEARKDSIRQYLFVTHALRPWCITSGQEWSVTAYVSYVRRHRKRGIKRPPVIVLYI